MKDPRIKRYDKDFDYSYAFGTFPTLDLLKFKSEKVIKVLLKQEGFGGNGVDEIIALCSEKGIKYEIDGHLIDKIATKENTYALGVFEKYETELTKEGNHVVLVEPRNMGNIGTIIRTMLGFNIKDLVIIKPAVDLFDPMIVRSSMGALFNINFKYYDSFEDYVNDYPSHHSYMFMLTNSEALEKVNFEAPFSLVFGNESKGLPDEFAHKGLPVGIPHSSEIDSLNLSVAVGIALYKSSLK